MGRILWLIVCTCMLACQSPTDHKPTHPLSMPDTVFMAKLPNPGSAIHNGFEVENPNSLLHGSSRVRKLVASDMVSFFLAFDSIPGHIRTPAFLFTLEHTSECMDLLMGSDSTNRSQWARAVSQELMLNEKARSLWPGTMFKGCDSCSARQRKQMDDFIAQVKQRMHSSSWRD